RHLDGVGKRIDTLLEGVARLDVKNDLLRHNGVQVLGWNGGERSVSAAASQRKSSRKRRFYRGS
ncbi:MAG: hypothetical protein AAFU38_11890, partial [Bacteroidota bacterium]